MGRANKALAVAGQRDCRRLPRPRRRAAYGDKTVVTGNPVRPAVLEAAETPYRASAAGEPFRLLVFGGSQGAQFFSDAVPAAICAACPEPSARGCRHAAGARRGCRAGRGGLCRRSGIEAEVSPFFTDMAERIAAAHLVISRSGASTVSEIAVIGRPALLVPYPHALDHDQAANAAALAAAGGAEVHAQATLSPERLAELIGGADGRSRTAGEDGGVLPDRPASRMRRGCSPT